MAKLTEALSGPKKAAILLLSIGEEAASEVLKNLSPGEIKVVTEQMTHYEEITPKDVNRVANEYYSHAERGRFLPAPPDTKIAYLTAILGKALGEERSTALMEGLTDTQSESPLEKLAWHDPATIASFLTGEHPQVIAVILANLGDPKLMDEILAELPGGVGPEVRSRLLSLREISPEWVEEIEQALAEEMYADKPFDEKKETASSRVAEVLTVSSTSVEDNAMQHIMEKDPALAEQIRNHMFPFEEFIKIDKMGLQKILSQAATDDIVLALRTADDSMRRHFLRSISSKSAGEIKESIESFGPVRVSEIEAAQKRLSAIARDLAGKGELLMLERKG